MNPGLNFVIANIKPIRGCVNLQNKITDKLTKAAVKTKNIAGENMKHTAVKTAVVMGSETLFPSAHAGELAARILLYDAAEVVSSSISNYLTHPKNTYLELIAAIKNLSSGFTPKGKITNSVSYLITAVQKIKLHV